MNTDYLKYLLVVADRGSIRQAAEQLHMKQQNLSIIIKNIEHQYNVVIFERSHKGVQVTADGEFFLKEVRKIADALDRIDTPYLYPSKRHYSHVVDSVNIYCTSMIGAHNMVRVMDSFREHFPYVEVNFLTRSREELLQKQNEKSVSILLTIDSLEQVQASLPENVIVEPLAPMPLFAVTANNNVGARQSITISVYELLKKKLVLFSQTEDKNTFMYELLCKYGEPNIQHTVNNTAILLDLLSHNDFWTVCTAELAQQNHLLAIPFEEDCQVLGYLIYRKEEANDFIMASLLKILSNYSQRYGIL